MGDRDANGNLVGGTVPGDLVVDSVKTGELSVGSDAGQYSFPLSIGGGKTGQTFVVNGSGDLSVSEYDHVNLENKGNYTHTQIDTFIDTHGGPVGDPHFLTLTVDNESKLGVVDMNDEDGHLMYQLPRTAPTWGATKQMLTTGEATFLTSWQDYDHNSIANRGTQSHATLDGMYESFTQHTDGTIVPGTTLGASTLKGDNVETKGQDFKDEDGTAQYRTETSTDVDGKKVLKTWNKTGEDLQVSLKKANDASEAVVQASNDASLTLKKIGDTSESIMKAGDGVGMVMTKAGAVADIAMTAQKIGMAVDVLKLGYYGVSTANVAVSLTKKLKTGSTATIDIVSEDHPDDDWKFGTFGEGNDDFKFVRKVEDNTFEMLALRPGIGVEVPTNMGTASDVTIGKIPFSSGLFVKGGSLELYGADDVQGKSFVTYKRRSDGESIYDIGYDYEDAASNGALVVRKRGKVPFQTFTDDGIGSTMVAHITDSQQVPTTDNGNTQFTVGNIGTGVSAISLRSSGATMDMVMNGTGIDFLANSANVMKIPAGIGEAVGVFADLNVGGKINGAGYLGDVLVGDGDTFRRVTISHVGSVLTSTGTDVIWQDPKLTTVLMIAGNVADTIVGERFFRLGQDGTFTLSDEDIVVGITTIRVPYESTLTAISYSSNDGDNTSKFNVYRNGVVAYELTFDSYGGLDHPGIVYSAGDNFTISWSGVGHPSSNTVFQIFFDRDGPVE